MIIVTGANGFIGRYLVEELKKMKLDVLPVGKSFACCKVNEGIFAAGKFDVSNKECFDYLPQTNVEAVIHCAAKLMIDNHPPEEYFKVNTIGTYNVLEYCRKVGAKLIYLQTHSDVNAGPKYISESTPRCFTTNSYGQNSIPFIASKVAACEMIEAYNRKGDVESTILRLANIRGVGSQDTRYNCVFHQFIQRAIKGEPIELWGALKTQRDLIYIKDVVKAIIHAYIGSDKGFYNIGSGKGLTIEDEAKAIIKVFSPIGNPSKLIYRPEIEEVRKHSGIFRIGKAMEDLHWNPAYSYEDGLRDMKRIMEKEV
jgi:UDP-glucose 4-epimerase